MNHGLVQAAAFSETDKGAVSAREFGVIKNDWKLVNVTSKSENRKPRMHLMQMIRPIGSTRPMVLDNPFL